MGDEQTSAAEMTRGAGETGIWVTLHRGRDLRYRNAAISLHIRATPTVEEFIMGLGNGEQLAVGDVGGLWLPLNDTPLKFWHHNKVLVSEGDHQYTLGQVGKALLSERGEITNLSFLRLVGISRDYTDKTCGGVRFGIAQPISCSEMSRLTDQIQAAIVPLYRNYMKPVDFEISITTRDLH